MSAVLAAMIGMKPRDELEGMLVGQLIAAHNAGMECYRRAMIGEQTFEGRRENLSRQSRNQRGDSIVRRCQSCREPDDGVAHRAL